MIISFLIWMILGYLIYEVSKEVRYLLGRFVYIGYALALIIEVVTIGYMLGTLHG